jgi:hypothetical protein
MWVESSSSASVPYASPRGATRALIALDLSASQLESHCFYFSRNSPPIVWSITS